MKSVSDKLASYLPQLENLEANAPGSLALGVLLLEMASSLDVIDGEEALKLFDRAEAIFRDRDTENTDTAEGHLAHCLNNRSALLADCGVWPAAVASAKEASNIRRERLGRAGHAQQDTARLDLGYSLGALARAEYGRGEVKSAIAACAEALKVLQPFAARRDDPAFVLLGKLIAFYSQLCNLAHQTPDASLLMPIAKAFTKVK